MAYYSNLVVNKDIVKEVRLFGLSDEFINRYKSVFAKYFSGLKRLIIRENIWQMVLSVFTTAANCILFLYVAYMVIQGKLEVGDYNLYTNALNSNTSGVNTINTSTATIFEGTLFIENVIAFIQNGLSPTWAVSNILDTYADENYMVDIKYEIEGDTTLRDLL